MAAAAISVGRGHRIVRATDVGSAWWRVTDSGGARQGRVADGGGGRARRRRSGGACVSLLSLSFLRFLCPLFDEAIVPSQRDAHPSWGTVHTDLADQLLRGELELLAT
uniref:Uncharacterized protein n=1 Tax=Oryza brachyantha TaxID=4533 RepID=J3KXF8_ORYBR